MAAVAQRAEVAVERLDVAAYTIPTEEPESDGTFAWDSTTIVVVHAEAGGERGLGYTYGPAAAGCVVRGLLADAVEGVDALAVGSAWRAMVGAVRNAGRPGIAAGAISAVDAALWDLKARLLGVPLASLLGRVRDAVPLYGSGGFTSYSVEELRRRLAGFVDEGLTRVKMKVGREPGQDVARVRAAREAVGAEIELYVDANGAYTCKQALGLADEFAALGVRWFEEPVSSDDLEGLHLVRDRGPAGMDVAAGEYGYALDYFRRMLDAGAVDCLQADGTRCEGVTGFLDVGALCRAHGVDLSAHTAPQLHAHPCCAVHPFRHLEWFHDHVRVERLLFDGVLEPVDGELRPDLSRPGNGLELRHADAERYAA